MLYRGQQLYRVWDDPVFTFLAGAVIGVLLALAI